GMVLLTFFVVVLFWESHPLVVLGAFTILYLGGGIALWLALRHKIRTKPRIFSTTSAELGKDYTSLQPRTPQNDAAGGNRRPQTATCRPVGCGAQQHGADLLPVPGANGYRPKDHFPLYESPRTRRPWPFRAQNALASDL